MLPSTADGWSHSLGILQQLPTNYERLFALKLKCGGSTRFAIQHLKWSHGNACLITIVVGKFYQRKMLIPETAKV